MEEKRIIAYKGFDENLCCRGFQYEIGKEYVQSGEIKCCVNGFHACTNPLDVLDYYSNTKNRYCVVEQSGTIKSNEEDTNQASSKIKIIKEISLAELYKAGIEWFKENNDSYNRNDTQIGLIGRGTQIGSIENFTQIGSNNSFTKIVSSGRESQICSSGNYAKIGSSGYCTQIGSSGYCTQIGSSGNCTQIGSSGNYAMIESIGENSVICCAGTNSVVKAKKGSWITLSEWKYSEVEGQYIPICVKTEYIDGERIKADTWYKLVDGKFVEQK